MKILKRLLLIIAGVLVLGVGILLAMGARSEAGVLRSTIEIARTPEQVWPWLTEPERLKSWISWTAEAKRIDDKRMTMIMHDANNNNAPMVINDEIIEMDRPRGFTLRLSSEGAFTGESKFKLTDLGGRTRVESVSRFEFKHWFAKLCEPLITPSAAKKQEMDYAKLKELIEKE